ncbi:MAG: YegS/Rv2252/BmrU family lipid kinase, partial [Bacteroidetes bacterium]
MNTEAKYPSERILFIINPVSGTGHQEKRQEKIEEVIEKYLDKSRFSHQVVNTEEKGQASRLARHAVLEGVSIVVAVGGDGTVNEVGQSLVNTTTALAIIPTGSGNGLARHLGLPMQFRRAIEVINHGNRKKIDTATLNGSLFVNVAGVGFDAHVARKFDQTSKRGFFSYFHIATSSYKLYKPKKYTITIDGQTIQRRALLISFANSSQFGNQATIAPHASV